MKRILKRTLAMLLCLIMVFPMCTTAFAADSRTEQYAKKAAAAGIQKVTGMIPVVGESISGIIGNFLPTMLGIENDHDQVMAKLNEISEAIKGIDLKLDAQQQNLFCEFHKQKIVEFNTDVNTLKTTVDTLYDRITEIEKEYADKSLNEKQVAIATQIESNKIDVYTSTVAYLKNLTDYLCGTQVSHTSADGIFQLVYQANCKNSVLGCEAALKSAAYVNAISQYVETAYKTLFTIYAAKLYVCENNEAIGYEMDHKIIPKHDISTYTPYDIGDIVSAIFNDKKPSSLISYYNKLFDDKNDNSAISRYNSMIEDVWFSYIESTDYTQNPTKIEYIPLDSEMGFVSPYAFGYNETVYHGADKYKTLTTPTVDYQTVDTRLMQTTHEVLTVDQTKRLMEHLANNSIFGTDAENLSYLQVLTDIGFSLDAYSAYVDKLQKDSGMIGTMYRDPNKPKWETDGMTKIFPMSTDVKYGTMTVLEVGSGNNGWIGDYVIGYDLSDSVNNKDSSASVMMANVCYKTVMKNDKPGDFDYDPNIMLLYFTEPLDAPFIGAFFGKLSHATIPIICIGAAAIIAVPTVILVRRKKKAAK